MIRFETYLDPRVARGYRRDLRALRYLRPPVRSYRPRVPYFRTLADALLALPDEVDPVRWLREERGDDTARHLLFIALDILRSDYPGVGRWKRGSDLPAWAKTLVVSKDSTWLPGALDADPFVGLDEVAEPTDLRAYLARVRLLRPRYGPPGQPRPDGDLPRLIDDLLTLPADIDPLFWLGMNHGQLAAVLTLRDVVRESSLKLDPLPLAWHERQFLSLVIELPERAHFEIEEFRSGSVGFALEVVVRTFAQDLQTEEGAVALTWEGLDQVDDDRGNQYLIFENWSHLRGVTNAVRHHFAFRPSVDPAATTLTFRASPARFEMVGRHVPGTRYGQVIDAGDLTWQIRLSR